MTAEIIDLGEVRRLREMGNFPTSERDEEPGRVSPEVLRDMALLLLGQIRPSPEGSH